MVTGNVIGLPVNMSLFAVLNLLVTAGALATYGTAMTDLTDIVSKLDSALLTLVAGFVSLVSNAGIDLVANLIPPAFDLSNMWLRRISFRRGGLIAALGAVS